MKILYFSRDYTPHDYRFLAALAATKHKVAYLRLERGGIQLEDRPLPAQIEIIPWSGGNRAFTLRDGPRLLFELRSILRRLKPDLVQAGPLQRSALLAALAGARPLVSMSWGYDLLQDAQRDAVWRWATRYTLSHSAMMIGDCDTIRKQAILFGMPEEHIVTFPWGIDLEHFAPPVQPGEDGRARSKPFTLLSARGWEPVYGVDIIVRAFILAIQRIPDLRLVMLGNGSQKPWVQKTFRQAGLLDPSGTTDTIQEPRVIFPGQIKYADLPRYYHSADLYVSASHSDGSSISLLEAMACGLPALVSDIPGNREWVRPGENGWLFPDGDADSLAQAILNAAAQHDRLPAMGEAACRTAQERADWRQNFQRLLEAFKRVYPEATHG